MIVGQASLIRESTTENKNDKLRPSIFQRLPQIIS